MSSSSRILPWEAHLLREHGVRPAPTTKPRKAKHKTTAFQHALAEALTLASDPAHVLTLSRVYAQTLETAPPSRRRRRRRRKPNDDGHDDAAAVLVNEAERQEAMTRSHLEAAVRECEREYRAILAIAANEPTPNAGATSRRLVRAIRRLDKATEALREFQRIALHPSPPI